MFKQSEKPDEYFKTEHGRVLTPVVTLESDYGFKIQIVLDDRNYVIYKNSDRGYKQSAWINWETLEALKKLPPPK